MERRLASAQQSSPLFKRHGDHGDEEEEEEEEGHDMMAHHDMAPAASMPMSMEHEEVESHHHEPEEEHEHANMHTSSSDEHGHEHEHEHEHEHGHSHGHEDMQLDGPSPSSVPDASIAGIDLRTLPVWHTHGGHGHSHGSGPVKEKLNETLLFRSKGPDPLSYIEWDFGYGLGSEAQLRRFMTDADVLAGTEKMGVVDGRWRKLFDEKNAEQRQAIANDIASRLPGKEGEPSRHRGLLMLHIVSAVLSCFVLLPVALVLRAAHSTLAPLASLLYLTVPWRFHVRFDHLQGTDPRLYPDNAHGSMGWAILLDLAHHPRYRCLPPCWSDLVSFHGSPLQQAQQQQLAPHCQRCRSSQRSSVLERCCTCCARSWSASAHNNESYDAMEEEAMLSEAAQSDAQEIDVEKHMQHRPSSRQSAGSSRNGSGTGSPHRVHFDDHQGRGGSAESVVSPAEWVGSGSTVVSNSGEHHRRGSNNITGDRMVASPTKQLAIRLATRSSVVTLLFCLQ